MFCHAPRWGSTFSCTPIQNTYMFPSPINELRGQQMWWVSLRHSFPLGRNHRQLALPIVSIYELRSYTG
jgi:hypothetical protein